MKMLHVLCMVSIFVIFHNVAGGDVLSCEQGYNVTENGHKISLTNITEEWIQNCSYTFENFRNVWMLVILVKNSVVPLTSLHESLSRNQLNRNVHKLIVTDSRLMEVPSDILTSYDALRYIDLSSNGISKLEENAFYNMDKLQKIYLSYNRITEISAKVFNNLPALLELNLNNNDVRVISDDGIISAPMLAIINLNKNQLSEIPYKAIEMAKFVDVSHNSFTAITDDIVTMKRLEGLNIANNRLEKISRNIALLPDLTELDIHNNNLTDLPMEMYTIFNRSETPIKLKFNQWICDCSLMWLMKLIQKEYTNETIFCDQPFHANMAEYDVSSMTCNVIVLEEPDLSLEVICVVAIPSAGALCLVVTVACLWRRKKQAKHGRPIKMIINGSYYRPCSVADVSSLPVFTNLWDGIAMDSNDIHKQALEFSDTNTNGKLRLNKLIGRGAFGDVYEGSASCVDNIWRKVAVKKIRDNTSNTDTSLLEREFQHLTEIGKHPNIIQVYGSGTISESLIIVMELAEHGDLLAFLLELRCANSKVVNNLDKSEEKSYLQTHIRQLFVFMWNVAKGMEYLSRQKIVHRDLAARNILLGKGPVAKISDFGLSRDVYETGYYYEESKGRLPYKWMSPETLSSGKYTIKSDVWSYGVLLWEVVTLGSSPYPGIPPDMLIDMYKAGYAMPQPPLCPDMIYTIMKHCWNHVAHERPGFHILVDAVEKFIQISTGQEYIEIGVNKPLAS